MKLVQTTPETVILHCVAGEFAHLFAPGTLLRRLGATQPGSAGRIAVRIVPAASGAGLVAEVDLPASTWRAILELEALSPGDRALQLVAAYALAPPT